MLTVVSAAPECRACGVVAISHGWRVAELIGVPEFGRAVRVRWRKTQPIRRPVPPPPSGATRPTRPAFRVAQAGHPRTDAPLV